MSSGLSDLPVAEESAPGQFGPTPPDAPRLGTIRQHLQAALALISADRQVTADEMGAVQEFMQALQQIGMQRAAAGDPNAGAQGAPGAQDEGSQDSAVPDESDPTAGFTTGQFQQG
jgi:hypothetical protein